MRRLIALRGLNRSFSTQRVLRNVSIDFPKNGLFAILGDSGSGKSTLLNIISMLDVGYGGECRIMGKESKALSEQERLGFRLQNIGYVFQGFNLLELESALSNVLLPLDAVSLEENHFKKGRAKKLLSYVGLKGKENQAVNTLSGGEKQRVAIARALVNDPPIILADEPTGALDENNASSVMALLKSIAKKRLVIIVSHDESLMKEYAEHIIHIKDGEANESENEAMADTRELGKPLPVGKRKRSSALSIRFLFGHALRLMKQKKFRSMVSISAISIGLTGLGMSIYSATSIGEEIEGAFSSLVPENSILMSPIQPSSNPISNPYTAPYESVLEIATDYPEAVLDYGVTYLADFENIFADANECYTYKGYRRIEIPSFTARTLSECRWLDQYPEISLYPSRPTVLEEDSIVLGLPYSQMFSLCYGLSILRNYETLGNYIASIGLKVYFSFAHYEWGYEDEQLFNVAAITPSEVPTIYHYDHRWNEHLFEEKMRFPFTDSDNIPITAPWTLNKTYYLYAKTTPKELIAALRRDERYNSFVFERDDYVYSRIHCPYGEACHSNRVYAYICDKETIPYTLVQEMASSHQGISSMVLTTTGSYYSAGTGLLNGFAQKTFFSDDYGELDLVIDAYSNLPQSEADSDFELPEGCYDGHYLKSAGGGIGLSAEFSNLISGREPDGIEEICLSESLANEWGYPEEISVAASISESIQGDRFIRNFRKAKLKVVGVIAGDDPCLHAVSDWNIDFFRDVLGMSSFLLEPTGAIFTLKDKGQVDEAISLLARKYPDYSFVSPTEALASTLSETMDYVSAVLTSFSLVALSISALLFALVMMLSLYENKGEAHLLFVLGIKRKDIALSYFAQALCYAGSALLISSTSIAFLEYGIHLAIGESFASSGGFLFSFTPLLAMAGFALVLSLLAGLGVYEYVKRADLGKKTY